jgi:catechol 2,3-dioxygenase-like lactoylglutathione lyase family enzyme
LSAGCQDLPQTGTGAGIEGRGQMVTDKDLQLPRQVSQRSPNRPGGILVQYTSDSFKTGPAGAATMAHMVRFDFIGLAVTNMAESLRFYRLLGLDIPADADAQPHVEVSLPGGMRLAWDTVENIRSFDPDWREPQGGSRVNLAFGCGSPAEVDKTYADLLAAGFTGHKEPWDAFWGQRYATLRDPDGNGVDLYAPLS